MIIENYRKERYPFIDLLKGVCIVLVVLHHNDSIFPQLSLLRMPLYFFLGGLFFSTYESFQVFVIKRINRLMVPFLFFFLLSLAYQVVGCSLKSDFSHLMPSQVFNEKLMVNTPLWFLISLFEVTMLYYPISFIKNSVLKSLLVLSIGLVGYSIDYFGYNLYFYLDSSMMALVFFYFGVSFRKTVPHVFEKHRFDLPVIAISVIVFAISINYAKGLDMLSNSYESPFPIILIASFSSIVALFYLCKRIGSVPILNYFGRYSLVVLGLHMPLLGIHRYYFPNSWVMGGVVFLFSFTVIYFAIKVLLTYYPQFIAQAPFLTLQNGRLFFNFRSHTLSVNKKLNFNAYKSSIFASHR